jgi:hypothetical protein
MLAKQRSALSKSLEEARQMGREAASLQRQISPDSGEPKTSLRKGSD